MSYFFAGLIAPGADGACGEALSREFGGVWRTFAQPFPGVALAFAADYDRVTTPPAFDKALAAASRRFPGQSVVRLDVECFGGACEQRGFAFRDGAVLATRADDGRGTTALQLLLQDCGLAMASGSFEPFSRNWFKGAGDIDAGRDRTMMRSALALAADGIGRTGDNPVVGCVIDRRADGELAGAARTGDGGRPHAEEQALQEAGEAAVAATAYVTLEPCGQRSQGGVACADLLIASGVARVVVAARDPHPLASGAGLERLREAGVDVDTGLMEAEARAQNLDFFARWEKS